MNTPECRPRRHVRHRRIHPLIAALTESRFRQRLTQQQVADRAGIHRVTIADIESGAVASPGIDTITLLAAGLGHQLALDPPLTLVDEPAPAEVTR